MLFFRIFGSFSQRKSMRSRRVCTPTTHGRTSALHTKAFHVPVETKRNSHQYLWRAIRDQLIDCYASDPATGGYGVYLVFWFGTGDTPRSASGVQPEGPDELREQLKSSLPEDVRRKVSVCVIDVSPPSP